MSINVLLVDDSALVRRIVTDVIERDPMIRVIGTANNGGTAIFKNNELNPDVIILDIEMPVLDGLSCLAAIMETNPKPVIMLSSLTHGGADATLRSLELGAVDFVSKPSGRFSLDEIGEELISKIKAASKIEVQLKITADDFVPWKRSEDVFDGSVSFSPKTKGRMAEQIIAIGISTGGPPALLKLFSDFPENFPGAVLVVQHMPPGGFTHAFAERLDTASNLRVREAVNGDVPAAGCAYIAPGDFHLALRRESDGYVLRTEKTERISGHRPSIDVLFHSVAESAGNDSIGVIMTGMGRDGANGIKHLHDAGGYTIAQDRGSSVVYGMNRVAIEMDAIDEILQLDKITKKIVEYIRGIHKYRNSLVINHK